VGIQGGLGKGQIYMKLRVVLVFLFILLAQAGNMVLAQSDATPAKSASHSRAAAPKPGAGEWYKATRVTLRMQTAGGISKTVYDIGQGQELKITADGQHSQIMLVNGRRAWMLVKNVTLEPGQEIDTLDGPVLNLRMALELLRAAAPAGPGKIKGRTEVHIDEQKHPITVNTASASGGIDAPWTLDAVIEPVTPDEWSFELHVRHDEIVYLSGTWKKDAVAPVFSDEMPLDGWQILSIGPTKLPTANGTVYDYGAQISRRHPSTLGELRKMSE
jgi:hypothetical protein